MPTNALGGQRDQIVAGRPLRVLADSASSSSSLALRDGFEALTAGEVVAPGRNELAMPDEAFLGQSSRTSPRPNSSTRRRGAAAPAPRSRSN
jgi:hypothetical protein